MIGPNEWQDLMHCAAASKYRGGLLNAKEYHNLLYSIDGPIPEDLKPFDPFVSHYFEKVNAEVDRGV